nr:3-hydroxylacyl-ACP dehydratase [Paraburkholderia phosphatilytica]
MCLLDEVIAWDAETIRCVATSHRDPLNPLRANGRLAAIVGIEYAAQAMAVHGAVLGANAHAGEPGSRPRVGFLTSVRDVEAHVDRLDTLGGALVVEAERMSGGSNNLMYAFALCDGDRLLLSGRATVMLDAGEAMARSPYPHPAAVRSEPPADRQPE